MLKHLSVSKDFENSLIEVINIIEPIVPNWFLVGGGCLGYIRNKKFIEYDTDIDIGIYADSNTIDELVSRLPVYTKFYYKGQLMEMTVSLKCHIDIFFLFPYNNNIVETVFLRAANRVRFYAYPAYVIRDGIVKSTINGIEVNVLKRSKEYCEHLYGKDYLIERRDWNCWSDPFNIIFEDSIISDDYVKSIPQLNNSNYFEVLKSYVRLIYELSERNIVYCNQHDHIISLNNSLPGFILFLYVYARSFEDTTSNNFANLLLSRINEVKTTLQNNYTEGLIGYGFFLNYLFKNDYLEIDEANFFYDIDKKAIKLIYEFDKNENILELIGTYSYIISRLNNDFDEVFIIQARNRLSEHIKLLYEFVFCNINAKVKSNLQSADEHCMVAKIIILITKICETQKLIKDKKFSNRLKHYNNKLSITLEDYINNNYNQNSFIILYAVLQYMKQENGKTIIERAFNNSTFANQPFKDDISFFIHNMQSYVRLSDFFGINISSMNPLLTDINNRFFKNGIFALDPYISYAGIKEVKLYGGLSGIGLLLLSLLYNKKSLRNWDELILLS